MAVNDRRMCDDLDDRIRLLDARGAPVKLERVLQEGAFGRVYQGTFKGHGGGGNGSGCQEVLVKTVKGNMTPTTSACHNIVNTQLLVVPEVRLANQEGIENRLIKNKKPLFFFISFICFSLLRSFKSRRGT